MRQPRSRAGRQQQTASCGGAWGWSRQAASGHQSHSCNHREAGVQQSARQPASSPGGSSPPHHHTHSHSPRIYPVKLEKKCKEGVKESGGVLSSGFIHEHGGFPGFYRLFVSWTCVQSGFLPEVQKGLVCRRDLSGDSSRRWPQTRHPETRPQHPHWLTQVSGHTLAIHTQTGLIPPTTTVPLLTVVKHLGLQWEVGVGCFLKCFHALVSPAKIHRQAALSRCRHSRSVSCHCHIMPKKIWPWQPGVLLMKIDSELDIISWKEHKHKLFNTAVPLQRSIK